jgi:homoserine kinase
MEKVWIFSPASSANLNVGFDCMGLALENKGEYIKLEKTKDLSVNIKSCVPNSIPKEAEKNIGAIVASYMLDKYNIEQGVEISFFKEILPGSGLGSSASSAAGVAVGINELFELNLNNKQLFEAALEGESYASGSKHGDNLCPALFGGCVLVTGLEPIDYVNLDLSDYKLLIAYPHVQLNTKASRGAIPPEIPLTILNQAVVKIGQFIKSVENSDDEGIRMALEDCWLEDYRKESIPLFDSLKNIAMSQGALGFGISGSGPAVFALFRRELSCDQLKRKWQDLYDQKAYTAVVFESGVNRIGTIKLAYDEVPKHVREAL